MSRRVLIIGGGISGLSTAWWLSQAGMEVEIWERSGRPGGKIRTSQKDGYQMEQAAALLLNFRPEVAELVAESGLEPLKSSRTPFAEQNRYLLNNGALNPLSMNIKGLLFSRSWSMKGRLRMMAEPLIPRGGGEDETVTEFITRRFGRELLERAMDPFVSGTLASDPDLANAESTLGRLTALERKYGSLTAGALIHKINRKKSACITETFSFEGGMSTLVEQLAQQPGITFRTHHEACSVESDSRSTRAHPKWRVHGRDHSTAESSEVEHSVEHLIFSTPAATTADLLSSISPEAGSLLNGIDYAPLTVLHTGFKRSEIAHPLDGTGFLTPKREAMPFNGNIWMSSLFRDRAPAGKALLTTYLGGARQPQAQGWSDADTLERCLDALNPILGIHGTPEMVRIDRHQQALPLYHGHYAARIRELNNLLSSHTGLHIAANYMGGVSVRDRIAEGRRVSDEIVLQEREQAEWGEGPLLQRQWATQTS